MRYQDLNTAVNNTYRNCQSETHIKSFSLIIYFKLIRFSFNTSSNITNNQNNKIQTCCDENNISYDLAVQLGRTLIRKRSRTVNIDVNTKIKPIKIKIYKEEQSKYPIGGKIAILFKNNGSQWKWKDSIFATYDT